MRVVENFKDPYYVWDHDKRAIEKRFNDLCTNGSWKDLSMNQMDSIYNVVKRQGIDKLQSCHVPAGLCDYAGLQFSHIYIGVETDGYAHS